MEGQPLTSPADGATTLTFDSGGRLTSPTTPVALSVTNPSSTSPAEPLAMTVNYANSTQFGGDFANSFDVSGYPTGEYASMSIAADGAIVASYTNGDIGREHA